MKEINPVFAKVYATKFHCCDIHINTSIEFRFDIEFDHSLINLYQIDLFICSIYK